MRTTRRDGFVSASCASKMQSLSTTCICINIEPDKIRYRNTAKPPSLLIPPSANPGRNAFQTQISGIVGLCC